MSAPRSFPPHHPRPTSADWVGPPTPRQESGDSGFRESFRETSPRDPNTGSRQRSERGIRDDLGSISVEEHERVVGQPRGLSDGIFGKRRIGSESERNQNPASPESFTPRKEGNGRSQE